MSAYTKRIGDKEMAIGITTFSNRKRLSLYVREGNHITSCATFSNDELAYKFMDAFADFVGAERFEWFSRE